MEYIIFLGDSITDAFHNMSGEESLGKGYVREISDRLRLDKWEGKIYNAGHDGFTVAGVLKMLDYDCCQYLPSIVSVLIGCNDVGIWMNTGKTLEVQEFKKNYDKLLYRVTCEMGASVICMGPFIFPFPQEYENWIPAIRKVEKLEREVAEKYGAFFLPLHDRLNEEAEKRGYSAITTDGIHLTIDGARIIADEWLQKFYKRV